MAYRRTGSAIRCRGDRETKEEKGEIAQLDAEMEEEQELFDSLTEEINGLTECIRGLDKQVAEATETRKDEHAEYQETVTLTQTAIELIGRRRTGSISSTTRPPYKDATDKAAAKNTIRFMMMTGNEHDTSLSRSKLIT